MWIWMVAEVGCQIAGITDFNMRIINTPNASFPVPQVLGVRNSSIKNTKKQIFTPGEYTKLSRRMPSVHPRATEAVQVP